MTDTSKLDALVTGQDGDHPLVELLKKNYQCLQRQYRLGNFERAVDYVAKLPVGQPTPQEFYELDENQKTDEQEPPTGDLDFQGAIDDLYKLTTFIERRHGDLAARHAVLLLRCKCLIYEAKDYLLSVEPSLGDYFSKLAEGFPTAAREIEANAEILNGGPFANRGDQTAKDERAKVIKVQLIAALCGANELYRRHNARDYEKALTILRKLNKVITNVLPKQHKMERESFGLIGLSQYLTAKVLSAKGSFAEARQEYQRSAEAYLNRLRQKEEFRQAGLIKEHEYQEKVSVTVRRAALVMAFGDGYLSLVSSQITRALGALTPARAALARNSGRVYLVYVDVLWWACHRALYSSKPKEIDRVVQELTKCRESFSDLLKNPHYKHRTGLQLALAHYYRGKLSETRNDEDYNTGMGYLREAIDDAEEPTEDKEDRLSNPPLLAEALTIQARFFSSRYRRDKNGDPKFAYRYLSDAMEAAKRACLVSEGLKVLEAEAWVALGDVYTDLAELRATHDGQATFRDYFDEAMKAFKYALKLNNSENRRIEGLCHLRLTKLCLLDPNTDLSARNHFEQWRKIEGEVEHQYCKEMAKDLGSKLRKGILVVAPWEEGTLELEFWKNRVSDFLLEEALKQFVGKWGEKVSRYNSAYDEKWIRRALIKHLSDELGEDRRAVREIVEEVKLMERVSMMINDPFSPVAKKKVTSFLTKKLREALRQFVNEHLAGIVNIKSVMSDQQIREQLTTYLVKKLQSDQKKIEALIKREGVLARIETMLKQSAKLQSNKRD